MSQFELHPRLAEDCVVVCALELCLVLMSKDSRYPWFILVPQRHDINEPYQLSEADYALLWSESRRVARAIDAAFTPDKQNIAAIGNMVPQLHLHHVARCRNDDCWPAPIWGALAAKPMTATEQEQRQRLFTTALAQLSD